jgi:glutamate-1-semialdehyde 2,1-aminomutase
MRLSGFNRDRMFLLSTTHGAETTALAAAIAVMEIYRSEPVVETLERQGRRLKTGIEAAAARHKVSEHFQLVGRPANLVYACRDRDGTPSQTFRTLFCRRPFTAAYRRHLWSSAIRTLTTTLTGPWKQSTAPLLSIAKHLRTDPKACLVGRPVQPVFRRRAIRRRGSLD